MAPVERDLDAAAFLACKQGLLINGERVSAASGETFVTLNPSNGEPLADVASAGAADVDRAVRSSRRAFESGVWRTKMTPRDRVNALLRLCTLLEEKREEMAQLEALDGGKPVSNARNDDLPISTNYLRYSATMADKIVGETRPVSVPNVLSYTVREPVGVCGAIIPWNYPLMMAVWKVGPALAAGNSLVLKPAEQTPLTALRLGELALEAGIPPGVLNVIPGIGEVAGAALALHPDVDKIAFTGSTSVGQEIVRAASGNLKRVSLELGGKSPHIIFADGDVSTAIDHASAGIFYNQGQDCTAGSRVFVERSAYDQVASGIVGRARAMRIGDTMDLATEQGPLITAEHRERVASFVDEAASDGLDVIAGGSRVAGHGFFYEPTVLGPISNLARIAQEEIFGPVVVLIPFDGEDDAVLQSNQSRYGLAAGFWTRDLNRALRVASRLRAGRIWINGWGYGDATTPFGGFKMSGWGRENGREVFDMYTEVKNVWMRFYDS